MRRLFILFFISIASTSYAGCDGFVTGITENYVVEISDGYCRDDELHIYEIPNKFTLPSKKYRFKDECKMLPQGSKTICYGKDECYVVPIGTGFICHDEGGSIIAGAKYVRTGDKIIDCGLFDDPSDQVVVDIYECSKGCNRKNIPKSFESIYSCD